MINIPLSRDIVADAKHARVAVEIDYKLNRGKITNSVRSLDVVDSLHLKETDLKL